MVSALVPAFKILVEFFKKKILVEFFKILVEFLMVKKTFKALVEFFKKGILRGYLKILVVFLEAEKTFKILVESPILTSVHILARLGTFLILRLPQVFPVSRVRRSPYVISCELAMCCAST